MDSALTVFVIEQKWGFNGTAICPQGQRLVHNVHGIVHGIVDWNRKLRDN
jgi:hypothetical protein